MKGKTISVAMKSRQAMAGTVLIAKGKLSINTFIDALFVVNMKQVIFNS
jgi:hypothetical protein